MLIAKPEILVFVDFINGIKNKRKSCPKKALIEYLCNRDYSLVLALWTAYKLKDYEIAIFKRLHFDSYYQSRPSPEILANELMIPPHKRLLLFKEDSFYSIVAELKKIHSDYETEKFIVRTMRHGRCKIIGIQLMTRKDFDAKLRSYYLNNSWYLDSDNHRNIIDEHPFDHSLNSIFD
jgi:hypothetical protein